jgi:hypothetical protein
MPATSHPDSLGPNQEGRTSLNDTALARQDLLTRADLLGLVRSNMHAARMNDTAIGIEGMCDDELRVLLVYIEAARSHST